MLNGIIIVKKEPGFTSNDVVAKMRGICKQKKIGHTGTLDPDATGVLPVCLGTGTKLCDMLTERDKEYVAELLLGVSTDTQDISGTVLQEHPIDATQEQVREAAMSFVGSYDQIPPMYSALKVNGKKLYELAREGKEIERNARRVEILELEILDMQLPVVKLRVCCTKGTYIRTLCADIGEKLGCGGTMKSLVRTKVGRFTLEQAHTLSEIERIRDDGALEQILTPTEVVFEDLRRVCTIPEADKYLLNGNAISADKVVITEDEGRAGSKADQASSGMAKKAVDGTVEKVAGFEKGERVRMCTSEGNFLGVFEYAGHERCFRPVKMFL